MNDQPRTDQQSHTARRRAIFAAVACLLLLAPAARPQDIPDLTDGFTPPEIAPGSPVGSFPLSGFDTINPYTGRLNFAFPVRTVAGRGGVSHPVLRRIDQSWSVDTEKVGSQDEYYPLATSWSNPSNYGPGSVAGRHAVTGSMCTGGGGGGGGVGTPPDYSLTRITFTGPGGSETQLRDAETNGEAFDNHLGYTSCADYNSQNQALFRGKEFVAADGSGITFVSDTNIYDKGAVETFQPYGYVYFPNGSAHRVVDGAIESSRDRNGNEIIYEYTDPYAPGWVTKITDSLNRETTFEYLIDDFSCPRNYEHCTKIEYKGYKGALHAVWIRFDKLQDLLISGSSLKTMAQLFPTLDGSSCCNFNPTKIASIAIPDGRTYEFKYNEYAELSWVKLPTGARYEYDWVAGTTNAGGASDDKKLIIRRVDEKRTYLDDTTSTAESTTRFSIEETTDCQPLSTMAGARAIVEHLGDNGTTTLSMERHYHCGVPGDSDELDPTDYGSWKKGRQYKIERLLSASTVGQTQEMTWEQRPGAPGENIWWSPLDADDAPGHDTRLGEQQTTLHDASPDVVAKQEFDYDDFNNRTDVREYDFNGATPARRTQIEYDTSATYLDAPVHIKGLVKKKWVCGAGAGTCTETEAAAVSKTEFNYDEWAVTQRNNVIGHDNAFNYQYTTRGLITTVRNWRNLPTGKWLETKIEYDMVGNPIKIIDPKSNEVTAAYNDDFSNASIPERPGVKRTWAFPTTTTRPLSQSVSAEYDYYLSVPTTVTDMNGVDTVYFFEDQDDELDRLIKVLVAANESSVKTKTLFEYFDTATNPYITTKSDQLGFNDQKHESTVVYDTLGRARLSAGKLHDNGYYHCVKRGTFYDGLGRVETVDNPYDDTCNFDLDPPGNDLTTTEYDWLGRVTKVIRPDGSEAVTAYAGNVTTVTDAAGKKRESTSDALGRLVQVIEDPGGLDYNTEYTYNALDKLTQVMQEGNASTQQFRTFTYDSLSRTLTADNPEDVGSMSYEYDDNGNLTKKTDARGVVTTLAYDVLNRLTSKTYSDGTATVSYCYDGEKFQSGTGCVSSTLTYAVGKLTSTNSVYNQRDVTSLDPLGRLLGDVQITVVAEFPWITNSYPFSYTHNRDSSLDDITYPSGNVIDYTYDRMGRPTSAAQPAGPSYVTSVDYAPHGAVQELQLGNGLWEQTCFNDRNQPIAKRLGAATQTGCANPGDDKLHLAFGWGSAGSNNGNLMDQTITAPGFSQSQYYEYDQINRLKIAVEGAAVPGTKTCPATASWCREYDFDHFGNRWIGFSNRTLHMATPTSQSAFQGTTNRLVAATYDNAGNMTAHPFITPGSGSITYDANNLASSFTATGVSVLTRYDARGRRVRKDVNGTAQIYVYDSRGRLAAEYTMAAVTTQAGTYYRTTDHLGSTRVVTDSSPTPKVVQRRDFMAYGEEVPADSSHGNRHLVFDSGVATYNAVFGVTQQFTGQQRDDETGLDYFWARNLHTSLGCFTSTDPGGDGARSIVPQSWNAYSYVYNSPLLLTDRTGRDPNQRCDENEGDDAGGCLDAQFVLFNPHLIPQPGGSPGGPSGTQNPPMPREPKPKTPDQITRLKVTLAFELANDILKTSDCAKLFGNGGDPDKPGLDPFAVLEDLVGAYLNGSSLGQHGRIRFDETHDVWAYTWPGLTTNPFQAILGGVGRSIGGLFRGRGGRPDQANQVTMSINQTVFNRSSIGQNGENLLHDMGYPLDSGSPKALWFGRSTDASTLHPECTLGRETPA